MPGIRKPTNVLNLQGTANTTRMKARSNEPKDTRDIGECPKYLNRAERKAWKQIVDDCIPGVLTRADTLAVESLSKIVARMRAESTAEDVRRAVIMEKVENLDPTDGESIRQMFIDVIKYRTDVRTYNGADQSNLKSLLGQLAMLPADRSKVILNKKDKSNPFEDV